jgi:hypothetical protein
MTAYADTSFIARIYLPHADSTKALTWMQHASEPLPFTPLHRHELRNAVRLSVFRKEITTQQRKQAFREMDSDLANGVLVHTTISWTDAFREAEKLGAAHTESLGVRGFDLLHVGLAFTLGATEFLTFDTRQGALAKAAGLKVR